MFESADGRPSIITTCYRLPLSPSRHLGLWSNDNCVRYSFRRPVPHVETSYHSNAAATDWSRPVSRINGNGKPSCYRVRAWMGVQRSVVPTRPYCATVSKNWTASARSDLDVLRKLLAWWHLGCLGNPPIIKSSRSEKIIFFKVIFQPQKKSLSVNY